MELVGDLDNECIHGLTTRTCGFCLGKLRAAPYRQTLDRLMPGFLEQPKKVRRDCELCHKRPACVGNRVYVRIPRPPRNAWGKGVPPYPASFEGPVIEAPRIYKATHRNKRGLYVCDRCDPKGRVAERLGEVVKRTTVLETEDVFG